MKSKTWYSKLVRVLAWGLGLLVLVELGLRLLGLGYMACQHANAPPSGEDVITVLCLGDSITSIGTPSYPAQLEKLLNEGAQGLRFQVVNASRPGIDSSHLIRRLEQELKEHKPAVVTVMMGATDEVGWFTDLDQYARMPFWRAPLQRLKLYRLYRFALGQRQRAREEEQRLELLEQEERVLLARIEGKRASEDYVALAELYKKMGSQRDVKYALRTGMREAPSAELCTANARYHRTLDKAEALERCIDMFPGSHVPFRWLSRHYANRGMDDEQQSALERQLLRLPDPLSHLELSRFHMDRGRYEQSAQLLRTSLEKDDCYYTWYQLGFLEMERGRHAQAEQALLRSLELKSCADTQLQLGRLYLTQGADERAEAALLAALDIQSSACMHWEQATERHGVA